jgi:hypothetical protein
MRFCFPSRPTRALVAVLTVILCRSAHGQEAETQNAETKEAQAAKGLPPRATPADYQAHAQAGAVTVAAEFTGHTVTTPDKLLSSEDYVAVEVGLFGQPGAHLKLSVEDFSLRINGKKAPVSAQPFAAVFRSLKDPDLEPTASETKSKTNLSTGNSQEGNLPPPPVHIPVEVQRAMNQRVQKASLPEGDRVLPDAGLIFFPYRGKDSGIHSIELIYDGPAGKTTLVLQP